MAFVYDEVRLVSLLEVYKISRQQNEEEKRRFRDQKKLQDLLLTQKEAIYGSKPSRKRSNNFRSTNGDATMPSTPRRLSAGSVTSDSITPCSPSGRQNDPFKEMRRPLNFVSLSKEDSMSYASVCGSELGSPLMVETHLIGKVTSDCTLDCQLKLCE